MAWSNNPPRPAANIKVSGLLNADTVLLSSQASGKDALIAELAAALCRSLSLPDAQGITEKILEREKGISTTLDTGVSLPHARLPELKAIAAALAVLPKPLTAGEETPIRAMFLFFSPDRQEFFSAHLQLLRAAASLLQPELLEKLTRARGAAAVLELLRAAEEGKS